MKFELKNVKHIKSMSHETACFEATLYVNGQRSHIVGNSGRGGAVYIKSIGGKFQSKFSRIEIMEFCEKLPSNKRFNYEMPSSLETVIDDLFELWLSTKDLKAKLKKAVLFFADNALMEIQKGQHSLIDIVNHIKSNFKADNILNDMPFDDALKLYHSKILH